MMKPLISLTALLAATLAQAHEGHGLGHGSHWHASDAFGLVLALAVGGAALWWMRRK